MTAPGWGTKNAIASSVRALKRQHPQKTYEELSVIVKTMSGRQIGPGRIRQIIARAQPERADA